METFKSFLICVFLPVGALLTLFIILIAISRPQQCHAHWKDSGFEDRWSFMGGCQIKVNGQWMPENNYRELAK